MPRGGDEEDDSSQDLQLAAPSQSGRLPGKMQRFSASKPIAVNFAVIDKELKENIQKYENQKMETDK